MASAKKTSPKIKASPQYSERLALQTLLEKRAAHVAQTVAIDSALTDIPYFPIQEIAASSLADIIFFGGAAGGSKTWLLLLLALKEHRRSIIFRREFSQLRQIIDDSKKLIGEKGGFNGSSMVWRLPNNRLLEFGGVKDVGDERKYQGRAHDFKAFDELPEFTEQQFRFLIGWTRTDNPRQRCRVVAAGNPPLTAEGEWVIRFWGAWLDPQHERPAKPGELRWYAMVDEKEIEVESGKTFQHNGETITPKSRTFIPAKIEDNPVYMQSGYKATLQSLPEPLRSAMLYGRFDIEKEEDPWQVIPRKLVWMAQERWRNMGKPSIPMTQLGVDCARGGADKTVLTPLYGDYFGEQIIREGKQTPDGQSVVALILDACNNESPQVNIDVIGIGGSVYDQCKNLVDARAVNAAEKSEWLDKSGKLGMSNRRAEMYWSFREALDLVGGKNIALPPSKTLENDLCAARWELRSTGVLIEPKEDVISRLGRSPDEGESVLLAWIGHHLSAPQRKFFYSFSEKNIIDIAPNLSPAWKYFSALKYSTRKPCCYLVMAVDFEQRLHLIAEHYEAFYSIETTVEAIKAIEKRLPRSSPRDTVPQLRLAGAELWAKENKDGAHTDDSIAAVFSRHGIYFTQASDDTVSGWAATRDVMGTGKLKIVRPECPNTVRTIPEIDYEPSGSGQRRSGYENIDESGETSAAHALRMLVLHAYKPSAPAKKETGWRAELKSQRRGGGIKFHNG